MNSLILSDFGGWKLAISLPLALASSASIALCQPLPAVPSIPQPSRFPGIPTFEFYPKEANEAPPLPNLAQVPPANSPVKSADDEPEKDDKDEPNAINGLKPGESSYSQELFELPKGPPIALGECINIALQRAPTVLAAEQSLRATELGLHSLNNLSGVVERLSRDIPIRRLQADRGVAVAQADLEKVRSEAVYDVTRLYWTYVYARQQELTAGDVIEQMENFYRIAEEIVKSGVRDPRIKLDRFALYALQDTIFEVKKLQVKAVAGRNAALLALREAMGVDPDFLFVPEATELPVMGGKLTKEQVVNYAVTRRPELIQAANGIDAFRLEVCAQAQIRFRQSVPTLAAGSDLHSRPVPLPMRNGDYRPGAIAPEMPPNLVGKREDRVARAAAFSERAESVYAKVHNLVRLEAENSYLNYVVATGRLKEAKTRFDNAQRLVEESREAAIARQDPELLLRNEALAGKAQSEYLDAVFEHIKALATLERVTAGAVRPAFPGR